MVLVLASVLKGRSRKVSRPAVYGTCALYGAVISRIGVFITRCHCQEHLLQWAVQVTNVILWARCTAFQQPSSQLKESLAMVASSHNTHDWWCIVWLGICEMQCCFVDTLESVDSFTEIIYWVVRMFCHKRKMMAIVCRVVCDVHIVRIVAVWLFLHVTLKRRTTLLFYCLL